MKCLRYIALLLAAVLWTVVNEVGVHAQALQRDTLKYSLYFPQGDETLYYPYRENKVALNAIQARLLQDSTAFVILRISVSPEGGMERNAELAAAREQVIRGWLERCCGVSPEQIVSERYWVDWACLKTRVALLDVPWRERALQVIDLPYPKWILKGMDGGEVWDYLLPSLFPDLRRADVTLLFDSLPEPPAEEVPDEEFVEPDLPEALNDLPSVPAPVIIPRTVLAVKTNVLAIPLANIGVEWAPSPHWSFGLDWYYPWLWRSHTAEGVDYGGKCFQLLAGGLDARYWFNSGKDRLLGPAIGIFGMGGYYDLEWDYHGFQGEFASAGIELIYACPVFKDKLRLEFNLGLGYFFSRAKEYKVYLEGGQAFTEKDMAKDIHFVGPVKGGISLVLPIRSKKGGRL
jgi:hypothetical protein